MKNHILNLRTIITAILTISPIPAVAQDSQHDKLPNMFASTNAHGKDATYSTAGFIDLNNPFFKSFGTNGRTCASCHAPDQGWTITPAGVKKHSKQLMA